MPLDKLQFPPNTPIQFAVKFPEGKQVEGRFGDQMYYTLSQPPNSCMYLDLDVAAKLNILEPRRNEPIIGCKRWTGKKGDPMLWDFWRPAPDQVAPAPPEPQPPDELEQVLKDSVDRIKGTQPPQVSVPATPLPRAETGRGGQPFPVTVKEPACITAPLNNGAGGPVNGANSPAIPNGSGPVNGHANGNGANYTNGNGRAINPNLPVPPVKIPYDVAFREIVSFVTAGLQETHEQWSDQARQAMVCTIFIQASRDGFLCLWERGRK